jgi:serralysin
VGSRGDDTVNGGDGEDILTGNPGNDRLNGGAGNDRIEAVDGISCGNGPRDVVVFDSGVDRFNNCEIRKPR